MTFSRKPAFRRKLSPLAVAALAGTVATAWHVPAAAQRAPRGERPAAEATATAKANYSKEFVAAYQPLEAQANTEGSDANAIKPAIPGLVAAASTPDDRQAAGRLIYNVGAKTKDAALQLQGAEMIIASGKSDAAELGQINFAAGQLAYNIKDYAKAQTHLQAAIAAGYADDDPHLLIAETYFAQQRNAEGLKYLGDLMAAEKAAGKPIPEAWIKRGLATAYTAKMNVESNEWALTYARDYPSEASWGDAIAIAINTGSYDAPAMLDLLRLARKTGTLRTREQYLEYVDAADARKLPSEVIAVLDDGVNAKLLDGNLQMVRDARSTATARIAADRTELPSLQRDAGAPNARLATVMAAADALLSYGKYAEAEGFYAKAAAMPGANVPLVLTRQGIAQIGQGKHAEAQATLAKVTGPRQQIAGLWSLHAAQGGRSPGAAPATSTATSTAPATTAG